jgi:hypothetical protein
MKPFAFIVALALASVSATPLVAAEMPTTQVDCEKAGLRWKEKASKCRPLREEGTLPTLPKEVRNVLGVIGLGCAVAGLIFLYRDWRTPRDSSGRS